MTAVFQMFNIADLIIAIIFFKSCGIVFICPVFFGIIYTGAVFFLHLSDITQEFKQIPWKQIVSSMK
jgi:hypothetical protein